MQNCAELFAHKNESEKQTLQEHSENVAELSAEFAKNFSGEEWARFAGLFHDLGKGLPEWQNHLLRGTSTEINHSETGAILADKKFRQCNSEFGKKYPYIISYLIAGHHAGLPDFDQGTGNNLNKILHDKNAAVYAEKILQAESLSKILGAPVPTTLPFRNEKISADFFNDFHLWIRMLYSCLVDADFLDTEKFMSPDANRLRGNFKSLSQLKEKFDSFINKKNDDAPKTRLNEIRKIVLNSCIEKSKMKSGFFSLNVPTGGGKTLSSMAFALNHAILHGKKRVITAIPFTSIIEQTANVYKFGTDDSDEIERLKKNGGGLFGEENVLEHHCNFDFDKNDGKNLKRLKLSAENWDSPVIVTTDVQLFESIFSARSSRCRKLHNIADSVIILDEVQMIPPEFLKSILSALKSLVKNFGVTVIFCTATQPALCGKIGTNGSDFDGIPEDSIFPIIENPQKLAAELKRVELNTDFAKEKFSDWESVANELQKFPQVLCIVQTRKDCRTLHGLMPQGTIHLSALMCAQERTETVTEIKQKLKNGEPVRVICTRLVECGVDMDFPVVFKSMAGLDSVAQAAGRCNREGKSDSGKVFLFEPPSKVPSGLLKKSADAAREILKKYDYRIQLTPEIYSEYFKKYFSRVNDFDSCGFFQAMIKNSMEAKFQFRTLGENYHLINDSFQGTIYVYYESQKTGENNFDLIQRLQQGDADKFLLKKLARYSVNLPLNEIQELAESGRVLKVFDDAQIFVQADNDRNLYRNGIGLAADSLQSFALYVF